MIAESCIDNNCHYIDLSDGRDFVSNITKLDKQAKRKNVMIISGASSVPTISSAIIENYMVKYKEINLIEFSISTPLFPVPGIATFESILSYCGKKFKTLINGNLKEITGLGNIKILKYPKIILPRAVSNCDIPDLVIFPRHYKDLNIKTIRFYAGVGNPILQSLLVILSFFIKIGLFSDISKYASTFYSIGTKIQSFIPNNGKSGFHLKVKGIDNNGISLTNTTYLIANKGNGINIPAIPAAILVKLIVIGELNKSGAYPCVGIIKLKDIINEINKFDIEYIEK